MILGCYYLTTLDTIKQLNNLSFRFGFKSIKLIKDSKGQKNFSLKTLNKIKNFNQSRKTALQNKTPLPLVSSRTTELSVLLNQTENQFFEKLYKQQGIICFNNIDQIIQLFNQQILNCHSII